MSRSGLDVLVLAGAEGEAALAAALRRRRHTVRLARAAGDEPPPCDVLVGDLDVPGDAALDLLERLRRRRPRAAAVLFGRDPTPRECRRALQLGASDLLPRPFLLEELVRAVEASAPPPVAPALPEQADFARELAALPEHAEACVRELCAFLVRRGLPPSARARACGAFHELLDNAARHAYPLPGGRVRVEARIEAGTLRLEVRDQGRGFDARRWEHARTGGLARAAALAEELRVDSRPGAGACVRLAFGTWGAELGAAEVDLSEHDHLPPGLARRVLEALALEPPEPAFHLSPAIAVVVGRLLAGRGDRQAAEQALWRESA